MERHEDKVGVLYIGILYKISACNRLVTVLFIFKRILFVATYFYIKFWHLPIF